MHAVVLSSNIMKEIFKGLKMGTSNIVLPGNKSIFPPAYQSKSRLNYYSSLFNTVELNCTFYKLPMAQTFEKWSTDVGGDFLFTVKLGKNITHIKEMNFDPNEINQFMQRVDSIRNKKGCLLIQFPGKITLDYFHKLESMLELIEQSDYKDAWHIAVEFRHDTWYAGETFELLDEFNAAIVIHDFRKAPNDHLNKNAPIIYLRFHGPEGDYKGSYSDKHLESKAKLIRQWLTSGKEVYVYFNNTAGDAYGNARTLQRLMAE